MHHIHAGVLRGQRRATDPLELKLQMAMSQLIQVWWSKPGSSTEHYPLLLGPPQSSTRSYLVLHRAVPVLTWSSTEHYPLLLAQLSPNQFRITLDGLGLFSSVVKCLQAFRMPQGLIPSATQIFFLKNQIIFCFSFENCVLVHFVCG